MLRLPTVMELFVYTNVLKLYKFYIIRNNTYIFTFDSYKREEIKCFQEGKVSELYYSIESKWCVLYGTQGPE